MNEAGHDAGPRARDREGAEVSGEPEVTVRIGAESSEQVSFAAGPAALAMRLRRVRRNDLELVGSSFLPKQTRVEVALRRPPTEHGPESEIVLRGHVRRVQMLTIAPTYATFVRLEQAVPFDLTELAATLAEVSEPGAPAVVSAVSRCGDAQVPDWAARLVGSGALSELQLEEVANLAAEGGVSLDEALLHAGLVLEEQVAHCVAMDLGVPVVDPRDYDVCTANAALVPEDLARRHRLFPLFHLDGVVTLAMSDPTDLAVIDQVRLRTNGQVDQCLAITSGLDALIDRAYGSLGAGAVFGTEIAGGTAAEEDFEAESQNATVRLVRGLIEDAVRGGVSDIHIEPERDKLRVRIRVDGILHEKSVHPLQQHAPLVSRIKVLAKLDIAETRRPQDGHFSSNFASGRADVRVSTVPTVNGENVVLRVLVSDDRAIGLEDLGLPPAALTRMQEFLDHPNGMILVTGPTGSGKTTTLYAALARLSTIERNVVTIEDPVEKRLPLLRQTEVNVKAGLTFATGLRSFLRQDPDVIMVGEIRDQETAEIAVQAALTGHLVLSTLHTNTAAGAIVRLSEMGVQPFMITSSLRAVISQRLARRNCSACSRPVEPDPRLVAGLGFSDLAGADFRAGEGCARCMHTGYKGRVGIYEMLQLTPELSAALLENSSRERIEQEAQRALLLEMREDGLQKVRSGATTLEEIARITGMRQAARIEA